MLHFMSAWTGNWTNNGFAGDLRRHDAHVTILQWCYFVAHMSFNTVLLVQGMHTEENILLVNVQGKDFDSDTFATASSNYNIPNYSYTYIFLSSFFTLFHIEYNYNKFDFSYCIYSFFTENMAFNCFYFPCDIWGLISLFCPHKIRTSIE